MKAINDLAFSLVFEPLRAKKAHDQSGIDPTPSHGSELPSGDL